MSQSTICTEGESSTDDPLKTDSKNSKSSTNFVSSVSTVFLQIVDLMVEGTTCVKQIQVKVLFDQGSQRSYVTKRLKDLLKLKCVSKENICINTFGDTKSKN